MKEPEPEPLGVERQCWVEELPLTDEQHRDNALVRDTREATIESYHGGSAEQFDAPRRPSASQP